jgi:hypothetical protein
MNIPASDWYVEYIGISWKENFNCWDLVKKIYLEKLDIDAKTEFDEVENPLDIVSNKQAFLTGLEKWINVNEPREFDLCAMGVSKTIHHVGIMLGQNAVFHVNKNRPACSELLSNLSNRYKTIKFYRHANRL